MTLLTGTVHTCTLATATQVLSATPKYARGATMYLKSTNNAAGVTVSPDAVVYVPTSANGMAPATEWDFPRPPGGSVDGAFDLAAWTVKGTIGDVIYVVYFPA